MLEQLKIQSSGGSRLGPGGTGPPNLAQPPSFFQGKAESMVISIAIPLSRCCLSNDEGPGPTNIFFLEPPLIQSTVDILVAPTLIFEINRANDFRLDNVLYCMSLCVLYLQHLYHAD